MILNGVLLDKLNTGSGINRTSADIFSWNLFLDTYGLGVGLREAIEHLAFYLTF